MSDQKTSARGADWTQLLTDPDVVKNLRKLLQTYRDAPPEKRDQALVEAMREIKRGAGTNIAAQGSAPASTGSLAAPVATPPEASPPFEPDIFTPSWGQDRRQYPRMKCFVAVELRVQGSDTPIWGNLSNTSLGGAFVETATPVPNGVPLEVGLWVANGKIWVKGIILTGVVTKSNPTFGIRIRFAQMEPTERESLREFLKFVETTTKGYSSQHGYLAQMKR
jgi:PilZ domain